MKWRVVKHNWSDVSIYDDNDNVICNKSIAYDATEKNIKNLELEMIKHFNLMSAAPDLLENLKEAVELMEDVISGEYKPDSFTTQHWKNAIKKAEGV